MPQGGTATPIAPGLIARAREGVRYIVSGVTPSTWFGPMQPLQPQAPADVAGRQFDYPVGFNLDTRPRAAEPVSFAQLRGLADSLDLLRAVTISAEEYVPGAGTTPPYGGQNRAGYTPNINTPASGIN